MDSDGEVGEELGGVEWEETIIKIYCVRKKSIFNKRKRNKKSLICKIKINVNSERSYWPHVKYRNDTSPCGLPFPVPIWPWEKHQTNPSQGTLYIIGLHCPTVIIKTQETEEILGLRERLLEKTGKSEDISVMSYNNVWILVHQIWQGCYIN